MYSHTRDFVGYGANPPDPQWPNGARLAINFVLNYEEGSEYSTGAGDGISDIFLTEMSQSPVARGERDLCAESMFEYGSRVGVWRILKLFAERNMPMTVFGCAVALERNPEVARAFVAAGHDLCCHGWRWIEHYKLSEAEERDHIRLAIDSLTRTMGSRPLGWYCRYGPSVNTRRLLAEEGGFLYDSDAYNDELPYYLDVEGHRQLVVPYSQANNDTKFTNGLFASGQDYFDYHRDAFDMLYAEGDTAPKMMSVGMHCRLLGHPSRALGLARLLDHVAAHQDVWVTGRLDIARHWLAVHPPQ
jgi:allantoinase